jgi:pimeloyl-ACP methyl ester carboxylesterase
VATVVIVHGMWSGGWYFQPTARILRAAGHEVYTPTLTGVGERVHLGSRETDLETHVLDVVNVLEYEDLHHVVLVGFSYGGVVATVVADRVPERISQLIYLDAWVPKNGERLAELIPEAAARFQAIAEEVGDGWMIPRDPPEPRKTVHPIGGLLQPAVLRNEEATSALPRSYVLFTRNSFYHAPVMARMAAEARSAGWRCRELDVDHTAPETHPRELAELLLELVSTSAEGEGPRTEPTAPAREAPGSGCGPGADRA